MFISETGEIRNSHELDHAFGKIGSIHNFNSIKHIVESPEFRKYWNINKDNIHVCKDCEFRYMCTSSSIPRPVSGGCTYMQNECTYNPYLGKWKGENGYQSLNESGIHFVDGHFHADLELLQQVQAQLEY